MSVIALFPLIVYPHTLLFLAQNGWRWSETLLCDSVTGMDQFTLCIYRVLIRIFFFVHFILICGSLPFPFILGLQAFHVLLVLSSVTLLFPRNCGKLSPTFGLIEFGMC